MSHLWTCKCNRIVGVWTRLYAKLYTHTLAIFACFAFGLFPFADTPILVLEAVEVLALGRP